MATSSVRTINDIDIYIPQKNISLVFMFGSINIYPINILLARTPIVIGIDIYLDIQEVNKSSIGCKNINVYIC